MRPRHSAMRASAGFTVIELMVALVLGLVVVLAGLSMYVNAAASSKTGRESGRLNADAQAVLQLVAGQLRMAGYSPPRLAVADRGYRTRNYEGPPVLGCDGGFKDPSAAALDCNGGSGSDAVAVFYEADEANAATQAASVLDCAGTPVQPQDVDQKLITGYGSEKFSLVENRYFVIPGAGGEGTLACTGRSGGTPTLPVILAAGVVDFQLTYMATQPGGKYVAAEAKAIAPAAAGAQESWLAAQGVSLCLVIASEGAAGASPVPYLDCAGKTVTPADNRLRRRYVTTVALRNRTPVPL